MRNHIHGTADYFRQSIVPSREEPRIAKYDHDYECQPYPANSFPNSPLPIHGMPDYQPAFPTTEPYEHHQKQEEHEDGNDEEEEEEEEEEEVQLPPLEQQQQFSPYVSDMAVYNLDHEPAHQTPASYDAVYEQRQSAAIESLSSQFAVPQFFPSSDPLTTIDSPYLTSPPVPSSYNRSEPNGHHSSPESCFPPSSSSNNMVGYGAASPSSSHHLKQPVYDRETGVEEAYEQFHNALKDAFNHVHVGSLRDASRFMLELSRWLVANVHELGCFFFFFFFFFLKSLFLC